VNVLVVHLAAPRRRRSPLGIRLVQLGLLDQANLPVAGAEAARKALDPTAVASNLPMKRTIADDLL
jgi:hypothetical protein